MLFRYKELRAQIILSHQLIVADCKRPDPRKDEVLSDLICKRFERDKEYIGCPEPEESKVSLETSEA